MNFLQLILLITVYWLVLGVAGAMVLRWLPNKIRYIFLLSALGSLALFVVSTLSLTHSVLTLILPIGIPGFPVNFHLDALAAFFLMLLAAASFGIQLFSSDYYHDFSPRDKSLLCLQYHLFLVGMAWVLLAADAYSFLIAWELMAVASYFLVVSFKTTQETQRAGFLYLVMAHVSALTILLSFAVMLHGQNGFTFALMQQKNLSPALANLAFILALIGFGAKAGLLPLHVWLPEAHPAAPSPVSALMSGVMLKTAIYGLLRVSFNLLTINPPIWWGVSVLTMGLSTAIFAVIMAAMQTDMKRLLAYSSMENIGIIVAAIGLALLFKASGHNIFAALALTAALYHSLNHAFFKSLLFLGTGSVLHAAGEHNLGKLGGLITRMPWVAGLILIATLAIAGLPPLNGFISEWLLLQAFLFAPKISASYLTMLIPLAAAALVLTIGLAAYVMVKFYGIIFLGRPREKQLTQAADASILGRSGLIWLASGCILLGILPLILLRQLQYVVGLLLTPNASSLLLNSNWWFLIPTSPERASYSPLIFLLVIGAVVAIVYLGVRLFFHGRLRRSAAWSCGYPLQTARMQDSAEGFGQPIKLIFSMFLRIQMHLPSAFDKTPHYQMTAEDRFWYVLYFPIVRLTAKCSALISKLQTGKISVYLLYALATLLILWWWVLL